MSVLSEELEVYLPFDELVDIEEEKEEKITRGKTKTRSGSRKS